MRESGVVPPFSVEQAKHGLVAEECGSGIRLKTDFNFYSFAAYVFLIMDVMHPFYGKHHTIESNEKNRKAHLGRHHTEESKKKVSDHNAKYWLGKQRSQETKEKIRRSLKGRSLPKEHRKKIKEGMQSNDVREKCRSGSIGRVPWCAGKHLSLETKEKISRAKKGVPSIRKGIKWSTPYPDDAKEKNRQAAKRLWKNPSYRERCIKRSLDALRSVRPTSLEHRFISLINEHNLPYKYVGDGSFLIGFKCPDFVAVNDKKICVEVRPREMCKIWNKCTPEEYEKQRVDHYTKHGWTCVVIWKEDIKNNTWMVKLP